MSLLRRLRNTVRPPLRRLQGSDEDAHFSLRLPARGDQEGDWLAFDCAITTREDADGEHLRLRSHLRADFSRLLPARRTSQRARLAPPPDDSASGRALQRLGERASRLAGRALDRALNRALDTAVARRALAPLAHRRVESWMDLHGTTAPLDRDADDMLPRGLARIGVMPDRDGPPVQSWVAPTPHGMAQITTLRIDERHLMPGGRGKTPNKPLRLAATFAQVVEDSGESGDS
jgi:hypothetical protein